MKNIETILKEAGLEVSEEQLKKVNDLVKENYKTVNDWQKQVDKTESLYFPTVLSMISYVCGHMLFKLSGSVK